MALRCSLLPLLAMVAVLASCAQTGGVEVTKPLPPGRLAVYSAALVKVSAEDESLPKRSMRLHQMRSALVATLSSDGPFQLVLEEQDPDGTAQLELEVLLTGVEGDAGTGLPPTNSKEAKVALAVRLRDLGDGQMLGSFNAEGIARSHAGPLADDLAVEAWEDAIRRAFEEAGKHVAQHLRAVASR